METWPGVALVKDFKFKPFHNIIFQVVSKCFRRISKGFSKGFRNPVKVYLWTRDVFLWTVSYFLVIFLLFLSLA